MNDEDLTPDEREAFQALARAHDPNDFLEERVVRALRARGLLRSKVIELRWSPAWAIAAAASVIAIFMTGFTVGHMIESRQTTEILTALRQHDAAQAAAMVERTGTAYVQALAALADAQNTPGASGASPGSRQNQAVQAGRQTAVNMLRAAANEVVRLAPEEPLAAHLIQGLDRAAKGDSTAASSQVVWF
jgi:hypothetical protein